MRTEAARRQAISCTHGIAALPAADHRSRQTVKRWLRIVFHGKECWAPAPGHPEEERDTPGVTPMLETGSPILPGTFNL
jgi:hypothetical protein